MEIGTVEKPAREFLQVEVEVHFEIERPLSALEIPQVPLPRNSVLVTIDCKVTTISDKPRITPNMRVHALSSVVHLFSVLSPFSHSPSYLSA
jgi:hypothetical protein